MRIVRCRVWGRHGERRRIGKASKRARRLQRHRQRWRRKAMPDHTGDAFEMACYDPIVGVRGALLVNRTADRRERQRIRLAGVGGRRNCRKADLKNQRERDEPDDSKMDGAENITAGQNAANRRCNISEQAPKAHALTRRPVHPLPDELRLVLPRLQIKPLTVAGVPHFPKHRSDHTAIRHLHKLVFGQMDPG
jgi:hypothetical protein